jgi:hypothetical protein
MPGIAAAAKAREFCIGTMDKFPQAHVGAIRPYQFPAEAQEEKCQSESYS